MSKERRKLTNPSLYGSDRGLYSRIRVGQPHQWARPLNNSVSWWTYNR